MNRWLLLAIFVVATPALAQSDAGLEDVNSLPAFEPMHWDSDAGPPDLDAMLRKETAPFDAGDRPICGDGWLQEAEACDGDRLRRETCESLGFEGGSLGCTDECTFDMSDCVGTVCGDGRIDGSEECDEPGEPVCPYGERAFEVCVDCRWVLCEEQLCGDGIIQRNEHCDTALPSAENLRCRHVIVNGVRAYPTEGAVCLDDCTSTCEFCGDGTVQPEFEACEPGLTSREFCLEFNGEDRNAGCDPETCEWDESDCRPPREPDPPRYDPDADASECTTVYDAGSHERDDADRTDANVRETTEDDPSNEADTAAAPIPSGPKEESAGDGGCSALGDASSWTLLAGLLFGLSALRLRRRGGGA